jgi:succinate dehydrogenase/fumarate reductase flavoprotein subunit
MTGWQNYLQQTDRVPVWPYPLLYEHEQEIETDILVLGGGIAGCWAAISAARTGARVALVEKSATIRSGAGGPGCDHWCEAAANPFSKVNPDDWAKIPRLAGAPYKNGIGHEIQCREDFDALLELEKMGGKIRDTQDEYVGAEGRDEKTKFMFSPRWNPHHDTNTVIRVWGTTFKPALKKECERLGVKIFDRIMATSLLTVEGEPGRRVIGATGLNNRTGEFLIFKSKATILCMATPGYLWVFNSELAGYSTMHSRCISGDGSAMAWQAGAELTLLEKSGLMTYSGGYKHKWYSGAGDASYENLHLVDNAGKILPLSIEPLWGGELPVFSDRSGHKGGPWGAVREGVLAGKYTLPFYGDFPAMKDIERKVTWQLMLGQESTTRIITQTFEESGFDPSQDLLQAYELLEGASPAQWREMGYGSGLMADWDLKSSLDGLYVAGTQMFSPGDHSFAAATGRYAGRKAAGYVREIDTTPISKEQVSREKARVYAPIKIHEGIEWKELHAGISRTMQYFCSEYKTETLLKMGLVALQNIEEKWVPRLYALDPHKLMRSLEDLSLLTNARIVLEASLARRASSQFLDFQRLDYPALDPPEWQKFITLQLVNNQIQIGEKPIDYAGDLKANYESRNRDYRGVYPIP